MIMALPVGAVALAILAPLGHPLAGVFVFLGLALGALNSRLVQHSVAAFAGSERADRKRRFVGNVFGRLALITLIALTIVLLIRPDGLGVLAGLAAFQLLMVGNASLPVIKELRKA
jgi:hypothetical protein